jgi:hypothetical protein
MRMKAVPNLSLILLSLLLTNCVKDRFDYDEFELKPKGEDPITIMNFAKPISLDPMEPGWFQYEFLWQDPMDISFEKKDDVPAIKLATKNSASMLFRQVDIDLKEYPILEWKWFVDQGVTSAHEETSEEGDDHPARIIINFDTPAEDERFIEIVWGNKLEGPKFIKVGEYTHYIVRGTEAEAHKWHKERVDLQDLYRNIWNTNEEPITISEIGLFCDTDDSDSSSLSYFADVKMYKKEK